MPGFMGYQSTSDFFVTLVNACIPDPVKKEKKADEKKKKVEEPAEEKEADAGSDVGSDAGSNAGSDAGSGAGSGAGSESDHDSLSRKGSTSSKGSSGKGSASSKGSVRSGSASPPPAGSSRSSVQSDEPKGSSGSGPSSPSSPQSDRPASRDKERSRGKDQKTRKSKGNSLQDSERSSDGRRDGNQERSKPNREKGNTKQRGVTERNDGDGERKSRRRSREGVGSRQPGDDDGANLRDAQGSRTRDEDVYQARASTKREASRNIREGDSNRQDKSRDRGEDEQPAERGRRRNETERVREDRQPSRSMTRGIDKTKQNGRNEIEPDVPLLRTRQPTGQTESRREIRRGQPEPLSNEQQDRDPSMKVQNTDRRINGGREAQSKVVTPRRDGRSNQDIADQGVENPAHDQTTSDQASARPEQFAAKSRSRSRTPAPVENMGKTQMVSKPQSSKVSEQEQVRQRGAPRVRQEVVTPIADKQKLQVGEAYGQSSRAPTSRMPPNLETNYRSNTGTERGVPESAGVRQRSQPRSTDESRSQRMHVTQTMKNVREPNGNLHRDVDERPDQSSNMATNTLPQKKMQKTQPDRSNALEEQMTKSTSRPPPGVEDYTKLLQQPTSTPARMKPNKTADPRSAGRQTSREPTSRRLDTSGTAGDNRGITKAQQSSKIPNTQEPTSRLPGPREINDDHSSNINGRRLDNSAKQTDERHKEKAAAYPPPTKGLKVNPDPRDPTGRLTYYGIDLDQADAEEAEHAMRMMPMPLAASASSTAPPPGAVAGQALGKGSKPSASRRDPTIGVAKSTPTNTTRQNAYQQAPKAPSVFSSIRDMRMENTVPPSAPYPQTGPDHNNNHNNIEHNFF